MWTPDREGRGQGGEQGECEGGPEGWWWRTPEKRRRGATTSANELILSQSAGPLEQIFILQDPHPSTSNCPSLRLPDKRGLLGFRLA